MAAELDVRADLTVELDLPGRDSVHARLRGAGRTLELEVSDPGTFAGRGDIAAVRALAEGLADRGLSVRVVNEGTHLITLGAARGPWWHRRLTGSRHIRLGSARGLWTSARSRARARSCDGHAGVLPDGALTPPGTMFPLAPTLVRRRRGHVTTTHATRGGGDPKLVLAPREDPWPGDKQPFFRLRKDRTTIGSGEDCDIRLPGLAELHAEVLLDLEDEFVLVAISPDTRVNGERIRSRLLRTASRIQVASWTMSFYREEYADHGRPYGGRVGGEIGHQLAQPPRTQLDPKPPEAS